MVSATSDRRYSGGVPRITEPTVAEHRSRQLRALLDGARAIVAEQGPDGLTLAGLARSVGLSRPALYEYFRSRDDLVAAMVEDEMPGWAEQISSRVAAGGDLAAQVEGFVRAQMELMGDGSHVALAALSAHVLQDDARERVRQEHHALMAPLVDALRAAGIDDPERRALLVQGTVNAATGLLQPGNRRHNAALTRMVVDQVLHGLGA